MKLLGSLLVFVSLGLFVPYLHADPTLAVNAGVAGGVFVETPVLGGETWVYTDTAVNVFSVIPPVGTIDNNVFTATFTDIAGQALLNVTDLCANVGILTAANPCSLGFTFTDASLGTPFLKSNLAVLGILGVDINANALGLEVGGASIGGGQAQFGFGDPSPSPTPEPNTLTLLGTGLLGMAGMVRKKLSA